MTTPLIIGLLLLAAFGSFCGFLTWQLVGRLRSLVSGIAVEGRCVRRYSTESSENGTQWHHVYGFTTEDGRYVEFEEDALFMAQGQVVTVRYRPGNPARSATVMGRGGAWSPLFGQLFGICVTGMFSLLGVVFVWIGAGRPG
ncbi:DUF3592 domain-containing protein [Streptomyces sp. AV19]|uniref:DUF3592 domain-containing protein n=1 Tax=Streptomyces sp. AV19 TaxID=2793068 RepID=UPI0018FE3D6A|nr:DUF3592 domain-containing protein [Streptomyces sp. AV19]MBH1937672.1 DUF3592 domain-containing protein [Streptomyces sp. AV19]MDG4536339.1 DUF3592 domain-containing protein [Streptomyces sp. AV19]